MGKVILDDTGRQRVLGDYTTAIAAGDIDGLATCLEQAAMDPALDTLLRSATEGYWEHSQITEPALTIIRRHRARLPLRDGEGRVRISQLTEGELRTVQWLEMMDDPALRSSHAPTVIVQGVPRGVDPENSAVQDMLGLMRQDLGSTPSSHFSVTIDDATSQAVVAHPGCFENHVVFLEGYIIFRYSTDPMRTVWAAMFDTCGGLVRIVQPDEVTVTIQAGFQPAFVVNLCVNGMPARSNYPGELWRYLGHVSGGYGRPGAEAETKARQQWPAAEVAAYDGDGLWAFFQLIR